MKIAGAISLQLLHKNITLNMKLTQRFACFCFHICKTRRSQAVVKKAACSFTFKKLSMKSILFFLMLLLVAGACTKPAAKDDLFVVCPAAAPTFPGKWILTESTYGDDTTTWHPANYSISFTLYPDSTYTFHNGDDFIATNGKASIYNDSTWMMLYSNDFTKIGTIYPGNVRLLDGGSTLYVGSLSCMAGCSMKFKRVISANY